MKNIIEFILTKLSDVFCMVNFSSGRLVFLITSFFIIIFHKLIMAFSKKNFNDEN